MNVLDLFSGIGGFSLGLERAGMRTVAFCEIEPYCRAVLRKHWPSVPIYEDVRELTAERLRADGISVDVICGGFPCQDISTAGRGAGLAGQRSGLWFEYARIIGELRPRYVIVENVAALLARGLDRVLGNLAALGFDTEWHCIPASAVGAPHRRDRIWIVAYPDSGSHAGKLDGRTNRRAPSAGEGRDAGEGQAPHGQRLWPEPGGASGEDVADPSHRASERLGQYGGAILPEQATVRLGRGGHAMANTGSVGHQGRRFSGECKAPISGILTRREIARAIGANRGPGGWWESEPDVGRMADGVPARAHRLRGLGNAVVPQIPEIIGRAIMQAEQGRVGE